ncbi:MAG: thioredoxin [Pseudomonadales bacterium]
MNTTVSDNTASARVFDASIGSFEQDVILKSREVPVLVDFWATWCGPCKSLGPILDKLVEDYGGAFVLAKVDVDREQQLAGHFQIRSVPTVMLVKDGRIVGGFPGAQPEGQIRRFLAEHGVEPAAAAEPEPLDPAAQVERLRAAIADAPDRAELKLDLVEALVDLDELAEAERLLESLPANLGADARANRARSRIAFGHLAESAPQRDVLEQRLAADPADTEARRLLGVRLIAAGETQAGLEALIEAMQKGRAAADDLPRKTLVDAFSLIDDPALVRSYRRRMNALLF